MPGVCVLEPTKADASGLSECLCRALAGMGIENLLERVLKPQAIPVLVGCGTDGASVNVSARNGMRGKLQPWLYWAWCYAHPLELACKDAFSSRLFHDIDDMLLRLYYLYEKSPKKCRELSDLIDDLKEILNSLKVATYLYELMGVAGSHTRGRPYKESLIGMELSLTI